MGCCHSKNDGPKGDVGKNDGIIKPPPEIKIDEDEKEKNYILAEINVKEEDLKKKYKDFKFI